CMGRTQGPDQKRPGSRFARYCFSIHRARTADGLHGGDQHALSFRTGAFMHNRPSAIVLGRARRACYWSVCQSQWSGELSDLIAGYRLLYGNSLATKRAEGISLFFRLATPLEPSGPDVALVLPDNPGGIGGSRC